jgi:alkylated DNA repair dioxygenase AlkB
MTGLTIPGLRYVPGFLDPDAQARLLAATDAGAWQRSGGRAVQIYGYTYHHTKGGIYRIGDLPSWVDDLATRLVRDGLMPNQPDQMIANDYTPGSGIFPHVDLEAFADTIVSISLGSACVMEFTDTDSNRLEQLLLDPGSALVLSGDARYRWKHGIPARATDVWMGRDLPRGRRVSLTFRKMLHPATVVT